MEFLFLQRRQRAQPSLLTKEGWARCREKQEAFVDTCYPHQAVCNARLNGGPDLSTPASLRIMAPMMSLGSLTLTAR